MYFSTLCSLRSFPVDFFARVLHTRSAVARLLQRQLSCSPKIWPFWTGAFSFDTRGSFHSHACVLKSVKW